MDTSYALPAFHQIMLS